MTLSWLQVGQLNYPNQVTGMRVDGFCRNPNYMLGNVEGAGGANDVGVHAEVALALPDRPHYPLSCPFFTSIFLPQLLHHESRLAAPTCTSAGKVW